MYMRLFNKFLRSDTLLLSPLLSEAPLISLLRHNTCLGAYLTVRLFPKNPCCRLNLSAAPYHYLVAPISPRPRISPCCPPVPPCCSQYLPSASYVSHLPTIPPRCSLNLLASPQHTLLPPKSPCCRLNLRNAPTLFLPPIYLPAAL